MDITDILSGPLGEGILTPILLIGLTIIWKLESKPGFPSREEALLHADLLAAAVGVQLAVVSSALLTAQQNPVFISDVYSVKNLSVLLGTFLFALLITVGLRKYGYDDRGIVKARAVMYANILAALALVGGLLLLLEDIQWFSLALGTVVAVAFTALATLFLHTYSTVLPDEPRQPVFPPPDPRNRGSRLPRSLLAFAFGIAFGWRLARSRIRMKHRIE